MTVTCLQDAVHEQQRNAAQILRGGPSSSSTEIGPGSAPGNTGQCLLQSVTTVVTGSTVSHKLCMFPNESCIMVSSIPLLAMLSMAVEQGDDHKALTLTHVQYHSTFIHCSAANMTDIAISG